MTLRLPMPLAQLADELASDGSAALDLLADLATSPHVAAIVQDIACAHDASAGHRAVAPFLRRIVEVLEMVETDLPPLPARMVDL